MEVLDQELGVCSDVVSFVLSHPPTPPICLSLNERCQPVLPKLLLSSVHGGWCCASSEVQTSSRHIGERFKSSVVDKYEMDGCTGRGFSFLKKPTGVVGHSI